MRLVLAVVVLLAGTGCASTGEERSTRDRDVITLEEIQATTQPTALDLIRVLRPTWLRVRGPNSLLADAPIMVYLDGMRLGGPESLSGISRLSIREIRFLDGPAAQARFGLNNTNGAIVLRTRSS